MKKGLTKQTSGCRKVVINDSGNNTTFSLNLPYSVGGSFSIGSILFEHNGKTYIPTSPIPKSWYINLNA